MAVWVDFVNEIFSCLNEIDKEDNNGRGMCKFDTTVGFRG